MATAAQYAAIPRAAVALLSAANTNRDGTGTLVDVITGVTLGTRVDDLTVTAIVTTTPGMIRLYLTLDGGTTNRLLREIPVPAITPSAAVAAFTATLANLAILLPNASARIRASTHNGESFHVCVTRAGDL